MRFFFLRPGTLAVLSPYFSHYDCYTDFKLLGLSPQTPSAGDYNRIISTQYLIGRDYAYQNKARGHYQAIERNRSNADPCRDKPPQFKSNAGMTLKVGELIRPKASLWRKSSIRTRRKFDYVGCIYRLRKMAEKISEKRPQVFAKVADRD